MTRIEVNKFDTSTYSPTHSSQYNKCKKDENSERIVALVTTQHSVLEAMLWIRTGFNADRDPAFNLSADPDPAFYLNADPDPRSQTNADPCGSGYWSEGTNLKSL
jgi:hypothetical protein